MALLSHNSSRKESAGRRQCACVYIIRSKQHDVPEHLGDCQDPNIIYLVYFEQFITELAETAKSNPRRLASLEVGFGFRGL